MVRLERTRPKPKGRSKVVARRKERRKEAARKESQRKVHGTEYHMDGQDNLQGRKVYKSLKIQ